MGVSASGKTTVGRSLAERLGRRFVDADDHHPASNVAKMAAGEPLDDADRGPWLATLAALLADAHAAGEPVVLACSALKRAHRGRLASALPLTTVFLDVPQRVAVERVRARSEHFLPTGVVPSQFEALERPRDAIVVDGTEPVEQVVDDVLAALTA